MGLKEKIRKWTIEHATGPRGIFWLSFFSFIEASFFPVPPDIILIAILAVNPKRWAFYGFLTSIFSVLGGIFGYLIGFIFFEAVGKLIVSFYGLEYEVGLISNFLEQNGFLTIFMAAFTPIPYKIFTITAGLFNMNIVVFIVASVLGRSTRFIIEAYLLKLYGRRIVKFLYRYFNTFSILLVLISAVIIYIKLRG